MATNMQGPRGLTFEGAIGRVPNAQRSLNELRATGELSYQGYEDEPNLRFRQALKDTENEDALLRQMASWRPTRNQRVQSRYEGFLGSNASEDIGLEAASMGFGESRFDRKLTSPAQLSDLEDSRARQQSTLGILGNSAVKMGVLAATTAADSWVGLPAGVINLISESVSGNINSAKDAMNAIVANPVSSYLQNINERSEDAFRNYQTAEERNRPWWENMFTANFIGDTIIKNAGFTIGAVIGGKVAVNALGKATGVKEARDAFKGLAAELGLSGKSASEVVELLAKGTNNLEKQAAVKALAESAEQLKNAELGLRIAGGLIAGTGEARIEALNGVSEFEKSLEDAYGDLDMERAKALQRLTEYMDANGYDINTPQGQEFYDGYKELIDLEYGHMQEQLAHDKALVANTIFALNVPLLTAGDAIQWGKLMLGGYAVDRTMVNGIKKVAEKSAVRAAAKTPEELVAATRYAVKGNKFTNALGKAGAAARNVFIEAQEEMNQSFFSETAKAKAMGNTTEFMERMYDPRATADTVSWLDAVKEGMRQSWLNKDDWVEGFAGGFMGFLGLPSISVRVNEQGKQRPKVTMEGGIWSPIREWNETDKRRRTIVETLNKKLSDPNFLNYYYGKIGNAHFDSIKEDAIRVGDKTLYEKADHAQLINDAMMFEQVGRLQDFIDIIDSFSGVSDEQIKQIKDLFPGSKEIQDMTTSGMRTLITGNVDRMKRQLDDYMKISNDIRVTYGDAMSDAQIAEMTWQTAHLDDIEYNLKEILSHPETSSLLSEHRAKDPDGTKDLSDYELVSSKLHASWLDGKYKDKKDSTDKSTLKTAISDAYEARQYMHERLEYIDHLSALSSDPELIQKHMERRARMAEELRRLSKIAHAANIISTSEKLSEFIGAMEDLGNIPEQTLQDIKALADSGNKTAWEYLKVRDMDQVMESTIKKIADKTGASESDVRQAIAAWNYFKHNSDTAFDLTSKHSASDIASDVAGESAINLLNSSVESVLKSLKLYGKLQKREVKKKKEGGNESSGENTKFKTTGNTLTESRFKEICEDLRANDDASEFGAAMIRVDLDKGDLRYDGAPASGYIYLYYKNNRMFTAEKTPKPLYPVVFDSDGNEITEDEVKKITGPDGQHITTWLRDANFPISGSRRLFVQTEGIAKKTAALLPIGKKKKADKKKKIDGKEGDDAGKKTSPHKFIAPNMDLSLIGGDGHAVAELLKSLPDGSELRFAIEDEDGPIYIVAGDSNMKVGTLPEEVEGGDVYSGLSELKSLIFSEFADSKDRRGADGLWVSEKYVNHIREKRDTGFETTEDNVPLGEIPGFESIKEPIVMLVTGEEGKQKYQFSSDKVKTSDLQLSTGLLTSGFAYLLVPSGSKYIPVLLFAQNVNSDTLDLSDPKVTANGFGKRVSDTIDKIVKAITNKDESARVNGFKQWALNTRSNSDNDSLQRLLYFRSVGKVDVQFYIKETCPQHEDWFGDDVVMVINRHDKESGDDDWTPIRKGLSHGDGSEYSIRDQIIDTIYGLEYETESGETHHGPLAQISPEHFNDKKTLSTRIREFIDGDMLLTDVKGFDLTMPSFLMDYWSVSQDKFVRPSHAAAKPSVVGPRVSQKKTKTGTEKIATVNIGGSEVQYNLSTHQAKIGSSKWFDITSSTKAQETAVKKLKFKDIPSFMRTARALAVIADKYGDSESGEGRIGNKVLLKDFTAKKDAGFIVTEDGGRFMTADELVEFKKELAGTKSEKGKKKREEEARRVERAKRKTVESEGDEKDDATYGFQEIDKNASTSTSEVNRIETVKNVRQAIDHLKKHAPQYAPFLDYVSGISFYDDVLVELAEMSARPGDHGGKVAGQNIFRFNKKDSSFTNTIVIGKQSYGYQTLVHELVHAFTSVALRYDRNLYENVKTLMNFMQDTIGKAKLARELGSFSASYAFEDPYEFVAEFFSNQKLQKLANDIQMPGVEQGEKPTNVFARFINFIANAFRSLFKKKSGTLYDKLNDTLHAIVDRQVELQETGKMVFKTKEDFEKSKRLARGSRVSGVVFSQKISTEDDLLNQRYMGAVDGDRSVGVRELKSYSQDISSPNMAMLDIAQLLSDDDEFSSFGTMRRLLKNKSVYEYSNGTSSSLIGVKEGDVFVTVRSYPVTSDGSYDSLVRSVAASKMPIVIGVAPEDAFYYSGLGLRIIGSDSSTAFVANPSFTDADLYMLGNTYGTFAEVLDSNPEFTSLRRERYSDSEWDKFSEIEKNHARKCIGI